jgi:two-component system C4-dicarboxylate transport response regulator DctD
VEFFRQEYCREREQSIPPFTEQQLEEICSQDWPGNIRELRNYVRRICVFGEEPQTGNEDLGPVTLDLGEKQSPQLRDYIEQLETEYITRILCEHGGKVRLAHQVLGLSRKGLYDKINKYSIDLDSKNGQ